MTNAKREALGWTISGSLCLVLLWWFPPILDPATLSCTANPATQYSEREPSPMRKKFELLKKGMTIDEIKEILGDESRIIHMAGSKSTPEQIEHFWFAEDGKINAFFSEEGLVTSLRFLRRY